MLQFKTIFADGSPDRPRSGDRLIYDRRNGTLSLYRPDAELSFTCDQTGRPVGRLFVGREWSPDLTRATAELYARLGQLDGDVLRIEGSFPTLETWEIRR